MDCTPLRDSIAGPGTIPRLPINHIRKTCARIKSSYHVKNRCTPVFLYYYKALKLTKPSSKSPIANSEKI